MHLFYLFIVCSILIILLLIRFYEYMAALVGWFIGTILGSGKQKLENKKTREIEIDCVDQKTKCLKDTSSEEEITESDLTLSKPLHKIIEETFKEEFLKLDEQNFIDKVEQNANKNSNQFSNSKDKNTSKLVQESDNKSIVEDIGFSFFPEKSSNDLILSNDSTLTPSEPIIDNNPQKESIDDIGFSFFAPKVDLNIEKTEPDKIFDEENKHTFLQTPNSNEAVEEDIQKFIITTLSNSISKLINSESTNAESPEKVDRKKTKKDTTARPNNSSLYTVRNEIKMNTQTRVITLTKNEHLDSTLQKVQKNWIIQFRLGPSLLGHEVILYCNYPKDDLNFDRNKYQLLTWSQDTGCKNSDDTSYATNIDVKLSGSFHYYFTYENTENAMPQGSGFVLVDPILNCGNNENLPLNCIQCQTVLTKSLGPFDTWQNKLRVAKESGYNMIHFTPIQELGASNSSYSLSNQLKLNPIFDSGENKVTFEDIKQFVAKLRKEWKMTSICDIVLNHTANESELLKEHPEITYNCKNCPYMRPSYLLDAALHQFSMDVKKGLYENKGIPLAISDENHLNAIRHVLHNEILSTIKLQEMFICNVPKLVAEFLNLARNNVPPTSESQKHAEELKLIQDTEYRRMMSTVDMNLALKLYNIYRSDCFDEESRLKRCGEEFKNKLDELNHVTTEELNNHLNAAVENCIAGIRYFRVQADGPHIKEISLKNPLVSRYFTDYASPQSISECEKVMYSEFSKYLMAHNGWVMNADPLKNFADSDSNVYVRRELIAWGDSVKLRYGNKPEDCPYLWQHMKKYVEKTAEIFDGIRLDNCHSTPVLVAEYLLDAARKIRPDLYVVAELFTNSDKKDNIFVNRLGITSLIREAMSAWDSHELGRLVYRYGGEPVGAFHQPNVRPLLPTVAHALFLDLTHDNPSPVQKRSVFDLLPSAALVNMACCASGSNRGYDELVPHHIHVVDETRQYTEWTEDEKLLDSSQFVNKHSGIISAKNALNNLHFKLGQEQYNQVYVDQVDTDIVAVTRHNPFTHESVILVAFTAFGHPPLNANDSQRNVKPLKVEGCLEEIILESTLSHKNIKNGGSKYETAENYLQNKNYINGFSEYEVQIKEHIQLNESTVFEKGESGDSNIIQLNLKNFKPGSIVAIKVSLPNKAKAAILKLRQLMKNSTENNLESLYSIIEKLTLADLNRILYRCDQEERDEGKGFAAYDIPDYGTLVYCGLQGIISPFSNIRPNNDLGHPICKNLRDGNWLIDYTWQRLVIDENTKQLGNWIKENTEPLKDLPRYLIPCYFDVILVTIYLLLIEKVFQLMSDFIGNGSSFVKALSLGSVQFGAFIKSALLPRLSPNLALPTPKLLELDDGKTAQFCVSLSAGLPHFSTGYTRNWGRDTFITLRGLFILTGRFQEARYHILGYAACLRHGLIPNLLDGGKKARFNCRDAVWWWLYCIKCYVEDAPNGVSILSDKVSRIFPSDDSDPQEPGVCDQLLSEVMQEALTTHFQGLVFRERNAGRQIDEHMTDRGFQNQIGIHPETGFVFGGNESNCGTWMDKMGSSSKAGIKGKPATPRDGSAVELIGLSKAVVTWLFKLNESNQYPYDGVQRTHKNGNNTKWTFKQWSDKIQANFEKLFWIDIKHTPSEVRPDLINKRGIYKDCFGASQQWSDYQLRCNFPVAMAVAPELFNPKNAWIALQNAEKFLLGPLGMKTLDSSDWAYCGDYDNSNDSDDPKIANGFNYHQGPEWVWPIGYFLRAKLHFADKNGELKKAISDVKLILSNHFTELQTSPWRGLPELTNSNGSYCKDSSRTQAWSMASVLEVLHDLLKMESKQLVTLN